MITFLFIAFFYTFILLYKRDGGTEGESEDDF
jgi:hypothetical protein